MLWSPKCSCQFLWRQIVIVMFTASQIKSSTHVSSSPKSKSMPSLLHTHTHTHTHTHATTTFTAALIYSQYRNCWALHPFMPRFSHPHLELVKVLRSPGRDFWWPPKKRNVPVCHFLESRSGSKMTASPCREEMQRSLDLFLIVSSRVSITFIVHIYYLTKY